MSDCCATPTQQFVSYIMARINFNVQRDDDEVCFVLDQHVYYDFSSASSLKQQTAGKHVVTLRHISLIPSHWNNRPRVKMSSHSETFSWFRTNQSFLFLLNATYLAGKTRNKVDDIYTCCFFIKEIRSMTYTHVTSLLKK